MTGRHHVVLPLATALFTLLIVPQLLTPHIVISALEQAADDSSKKPHKA
ncbi:cytochrome c biogenesis protein|nr:cytochrome c biogenesis protein [Candidatus Pantoea persica]